MYLRCCNKDAVKKDVVVNRSHAAERSSNVSATAVP